jgi:trigger factor
MKLAARATGTWQHTLDLEIPVSEVEARLEEVARRVQRRATLPGFRKGRVPLELVRTQFAAHVEQDFLDEFVPRVANDALAEAKLDPIVPPTVRNLRFTPGAPLTFELVVDVRPEVVAKDYKGLRVMRRGATVDDEAVEKVLNDLREQSAVFADLDRPAERGDVVLFDSIRLDPKGRRLPSTRQKGVRAQLGAPGMLPDLENGLLAAVEGQERLVDVSYPADYGNADLAGRTVRYALKVRKIQEKKLRDLDDNFARDVFQLEKLDELKSRIRLNLEGEERVRVQRELDAAVSEQLLQRNTFELPQRLEEWMLDRVITEALNGRTVDDALRQELEARYRPGVQRSLRREILLGAVARQEGLEVSDEEVAREIDRMAQAEPRQAARIRARYQTEERRRGLREALLERKALDWLIEKADVEEAAPAEPTLVSPAGR